MSGRRQQLQPLFVAVAAIVLTLSMIPYEAVQAQQPHISREFLDEARSLRGEKIMFCLNPDGLLAAFEREAATEITNALLLEAEFYEVNTFIASPPLDYMMHLTEEDLFIALNNDCDAFLGFSLVPGGYPEWLTFTRSYLETAYVFVTRSDQGYEMLQDVPRGEVIGTRSLSKANTHLSQYLISRSAENPLWRHLPYPDNEVLISRVVDGTLAGAIVWEPAVRAFTSEYPEKGSDLQHAPVELFGRMIVEFGMAMRSEDTFLRTQLDEAIRILREDGVLRQLAEESEIIGAESM